MKDIDREEGVVRLDGLDDAIIGLAFRHVSVPSPVLCYDQSKIVEILMVRDGMTFEEAQEFFEFNIACLWAGDGTPIFLEPASLDEIAEHLEFDKASE
jgi:hypothetical protein